MYVQTNMNTIGYSVIRRFIITNLYGADEEILKHSDKLMFPERY